MRRMRNVRQWIASIAVVGVASIGVTAQAAADPPQAPVVQYPSVDALGLGLGIVGLGEEPSLASTEAALDNAPVPTADQESQAPEDTTTPAPDSATSPNAAASPNTSTAPSTDSPPVGSPSGGVMEYSSPLTALLDRVAHLASGGNPFAQGFCDVYPGGISRKKVVGAYDLNYASKIDCKTPHPTYGTGVVLNADTGRPRSTKEKTPAERTVLQFSGFFTDRLRHRYFIHSNFYVHTRFPAGVWGGASALNFGPNPDGSSVNCSGDGTQQLHCITNSRTIPLGS